MAPTLAFGISLIFTQAFGGGLAAFWYHFAIMFEALFILTAVDAGTRVGRFMLQDTVGNVWKKYGEVSWKPAAWSASAIVVGVWGYYLYVGVTDPLGGINQLFPLFGISNQLLAAIALTLAVSLLIKHGKARYAWVPGIGLAWDLIVTMTASWQKVFSDDPRIGYFTQASTYREARDAGELLAPATDAAQMDQIVTNSIVNGTLQILFAVLTLVVVANAAMIWVKGVRAGGMPTTEVPKTESHLVAPSDFFATAEEKQAVRDWEASRRDERGDLVGVAGDERRPVPGSRPARGPLVSQGVPRRVPLGRLPRPMSPRRRRGDVEASLRAAPSRPPRDPRREPLLLSRTERLGTNGTLAG